MNGRRLEELGNGEWGKVNFFFLASLCDVFFNQQQSSSRIYLLDLNRVYKHIVHIFSLWHMFFSSSALVVVVFVAQPQLLSVRLIIVRKQCALFNVRFK